MRSKIFGFLAGIVAVFSIYAGIAFAQSYPSRPTFLSAGVGCNPNAFTNDRGSPGEIAVFCIGRYPYSLGNEVGQILLLTPSAEQYATIQSTETDNFGTPNAGVLICDGSCINGLTIGSDFESAITHVSAWELGNRQTTGSIRYVPENVFGTHQAYFDFTNRSGSGADTFTAIFETPNTTNLAPAILGTSLDDAGTETMGFGVWDLQSLVPIDTFIRYEYDTDGDLVEVSFGPSTGAWGRFHAPFGVPEFDLQGSSIRDSDDGNVNIANDVSIVGNLVVTGSITGGGGSGTVFGCSVDSSAAAEVCSLGGVSVANTGMGVYTVTHNLGNTGLACSATAETAGFVSPQKVTAVSNFTANTFDVLTMNDDNGGGGGGVDNAFRFICVVP